jgi:predicted HTH domain antitoxin
LFKGIRLEESDAGGRLMQVAIALPDDIAQSLNDKWGNLERQVLEMVLIQAYRDGLLSAGKIRELLGFATRLEVDAFLKARQVELHYDETDLADDRATHEQLRAEGKLGIV